MTGNHPGATPGAQAIPSAAAVLGYAGALPFVVGATVLWLSDAGMGQAVHFAILTYGAVILSFMGGVRWGLEMVGPHSDAPRAGTLIVSVLPALIAWGALLISRPILQLAILIVAFAWLLLSDRGATRRGEAPAWYPGLRIPLTLTVEASLAASAIKQAIGWSSA
jgi:hypothetical protein